jgi:hypothetical protein
MPTTTPDRFDPKRKPTYMVQFTCLSPRVTGHGADRRVWSKANFTTQRQAEHAIQRWLDQAKLPGERHRSFEVDQIPRGYDLFELVRVATRDPKEE